MSGGFLETARAHWAKYPRMEPRDFAKLAYQSEFGPAHMAQGPDKVLAALLGRGSGTAASIVLYARLPRTCGCLLAGAALAAAGTIIQGVLGNPLAAPNVIGVNAGAGLCTALCAALWPARTAALPFAAFLGALGGVGLVLAIGTRTGASRMTLVLAGVAVSGMFSASTPC